VGGEEEDSKTKRVQRKEEEKAESRESGLCIRHTRPSLLPAIFISFVLPAHPMGHFSASERAARLQREVEIVTDHVTDKNT